MSRQLRLTEANLPHYLVEAGLIGPDSSVSVEPAGEGNINWVRRVRTGDGSSRVVKQARPALERFPEYRVTTERLVFERRYYEVVAPVDRRGVCPRVLHFDAGARVLVLEDLGDAERLDSVLARAGDASQAAGVLGAFLGAVHAHARDPELAERFANGEMRRLHGEHIFQLPYRPNDFPLSPAVAERAHRIWRDREVVARIDASYARYLDARQALVHADVQPTNILLSPEGPKLLDAEIAHLGDPAFDLGTFLAHLLLPALARGTPGDALPALRAAWDAYRAEGSADFPAASRYAGIELLRRSLGAARVPAVERDEAALAVIERGLELLGAPAEAPESLAAGRG